jgi:hypothetical protein
VQHRLDPAERQRVDARVDRVQRVHLVGHLPQEPQRRSAPPRHLALTHVAVVDAGGGVARHLLQVVREAGVRVDPRVVHAHGGLARPRVGHHLAEDRHDGRVGGGDVRRVAARAPGRVEGRAPRRVAARDGERRRVHERALRRHPLRAVAAAELEGVGAADMSPPGGVVDQSCDTGLNLRP